MKYCVLGLLLFLGACVPATAYKCQKKVPSVETTYHHYKKGAVDKNISISDVCVKAIVEVVE